MNSRQIRDDCAECAGNKSATYHAPEGRFEVVLPSRCPHKDECEEHLLKDLQVEPHRAPTGAIVR